MNADHIASLRPRQDGSCSVALTNGDRHELDSGEATRLRAVVGLEVEADDSERILE